MVLPFKHAAVLITFLNRFINKGWGVELCVRVMLFLLELHQSQLVSNQALVGALSTALKQTRPALQRFKDELGYNKAALDHLNRHIESNSHIHFFGDAAEAKESKEAENNNYSKVYESKGSRSVPKGGRHSKRSVHNLLRQDQEGSKKQRT